MIQRMFMLTPSTLKSKQQQQKHFALLWQKQRNMLSRQPIFGTYL